MLPLSEKNITWIFVIQQFHSVVSLTCTSLCQVLCRCVDAKCANTWIPASVSAILPTCQTHPVSAANWVAKYRASNSDTSLRVSTFIIHTSTCTERPIDVEFSFGWMATASPVNNHGRITSGGFYRSGVETMLFESDFQDTTFCVWCSCFPSHSAVTQAKHWVRQCADLCGNILVRWRREECFTV